MKSFTHRHFWYAYFQSLVFLIVTRISGQHDLNISWQSCNPKLYITSEFWLNLNKSIGRKSLYRTSEVKTATSYKQDAESFQSREEMSYFKNEFWFKCKLKVVMRNIRGNWKDLVKIIELTEAVIRM